MRFDEYRAVKNDQEPDDNCGQLWRRWGSEYACSKPKAATPLGGEDEQETVQ